MRNIDMVATTVRQVITKKLEIIHPSSNAQDAAKRMRDKKVSSLVVIEKGDTPVGIVTERDLVRHVCSKDISSDSVLIQEIMSSPMVTIDVNASIEQAADKMIQNKVRHLLIVDKDRIHGMITPSDFTIYLRENLNMDDVNARILQSLIEDKEFQ
jgi:CBS domain-containing protein